MRKLAGVFAMSVLLALAACGGDQAPVTQTFGYTGGNQTFTVPAGVGNLTLLSGQGGAGEPENETYVETYTRTTTVYNQRNDMGGEIVELDGGTTYHGGQTPPDYCTDPAPVPQGGGVVNYTWTCYSHSDTSYNEYNPPTTGAAATMTGPSGFSRSWAGGVGGPASPSSEANATVVAGGVYTIYVPYGGSVTVSYYP